MKGYTHKHKRGTPKPLCLTCQTERVSSFQNKYCSVACIPVSVRVAAGSKSRKAYAYRRRAMAYRDDLERLGRKPTREDVLAILHTVYQRAYNSGYQAAKHAAVVRDHGALGRARERDAA